MTCMTGESQQVVYTTKFYTHHFCCQSENKGFPIVLLYILTLKMLLDWTGQDFDEPGKRRWFFTLQTNQHGYF